MVGGFLEGRRCCRWRAMEVASFVPGHVQNRGATPRSWTALCSKKNKVATPLGTDPMSVVFDGAQAARSPCPRDAPWSSWSYGVHVARPLGPRRPRHPRPQHCPWTFSDMENCAHGSPCCPERDQQLPSSAGEGLPLPRGLFPRHSRHAAEETKLAHKRFARFARHRLLLSTFNFCSTLAPPVKNQGSFLIVFKEP